METLRLGSSGPIVEFLQNILKNLGLYFGNLDGIYGNETRNAVIRYQKSIDLNPDGIVGINTWNSLMPYINGKLNFIVPTNISYSFSILQINLDSLKKLYPFIDITSAGKSVMGNNIPVIKIGNGDKEVFYSASFHANEWITSTLLMKFLSDYCYCYEKNLNIYGISARNIYNTTTIYIMPMVNPDGVNLVTGEIKKSSNQYISVLNIANNYPQIRFPDGWKANIRGVDLNLQFPAKWINARNIKYALGYTKPSPRDFVGYGPLTEPEALAIYNFSLKHNFRLVISYHTQGKEIYWNFQNINPPRGLNIANEFAKVSGYTVTEAQLNSSFAGFKDWFIQDYNLPGYTIEAGEGINPLSTNKFSEIYNDNLGILVLGALLA